jgi:hypothetical protein
MIVNWVARAVLVATIAATTVGCVTGEGKLYFEPSIQRGQVRIRRVAIVPNRLPLNLQNAEFWTERNWNKLAEMFRGRGFEVVDYATSRGAFNEGGLPLEDTKSSRDKYADLARRLAVDAIVIPYYGTYGTASNFLFATRSDHVSVATLQIFLADKNDFFTRADASGRYRWTSGLGMTLGMIVAGAGSGLLNSNLNSGLAVMGVGGGIAILGIIADLVVAAIPDNSKFGSAFDKAFEEALGPFFAAFAPGAVGSMPMGGGYGMAPSPFAPARPYSPAPPIQPNPAQPAPPAGTWADPFARPAPPPATPPAPPPAAPPPAAPLPSPAPTPAAPSPAPSSTSATDELERGCAGGGAGACVKLGQALLDGTTVARDERRAAAAFQRACGQRDPDGCMRLADLHERGTGVARNASIAITL